MPTPLLDPLVKDIRVLQAANMPLLTLRGMDYIDYNVLTHPPECQSIQIHDIMIYRVP